MQQIAEFLHNLFQKGHLKVHTIKGYKSAIVATLKARGMSVGTKPHICRLISSFYMDRPVEINLVTYWELTIVLDAFTKLPFKPQDMSSVELKFLTFKTIFLLSSASGTRQGEIHALDWFLIRWPV